MNVSDPARYAVLTGDIVGSSKLTPKQRQALLAVMEAGSKATQRAFPKRVPLPVDIFRGDSWQLLVNEPVSSLRIALFFRASLLAAEPGGEFVDTRVSIGIGPVQQPLAKRVSQGDGEAYRLSGHGLDGLKGSARLALARADESDRSAGAVICLIDALVQGWTARQAQAVLGALQGWTQEKIAGRWPERISQQAIAKQLDRANWSAIERGITHVEALLDA